MDNPYLLPSGPQPGDARVSRVERRLGSLMQDSKVASSKFQELPEAASILSLRKAGQWYPSSSLNSDLTLSVVASALNTLYLVPLYVPATPNILDGIGFRVTTAQVGSSARFGVYEDRNLEPTHLIEDFGEVATTSIGFRSIATPRTTLKRGLVWLAITFSHASVGFSCLSAGFWAILGVSSGSPSTGYGMYKVAFTYAALPAHLGDRVLNVSASDPALIMVKFAETPKGI